jgi:hypothetical protein
MNFYAVDKQELIVRRLSGQDGAIASIGTMPGCAVPDVLLFLDRSLVPIWLSRAD